MPDTNALADDLLRSAARLSRWASRHADLGMPYAQARVLALVDDLGPSRITALAAADDCSQPSMTAHVQRLESDGLVSRTPDPADARATQVELTPGGRSVLDGIRRSRGAALAPVLDTVSPHEGRLEATRAAPSPAPSPQTPSPTPEQP